MSKLITRGRSQENTMQTRLSCHNTIHAYKCLNKAKVARKTLAYAHALTVLLLSGLSFFSEHRPGHTLAVLFPLRGNQGNHNQKQSK
jgi:hypothetical protein